MLIGTSANFFRWSFKSKPSCCCYLGLCGVLQDKPHLHPRVPQPVQLCPRHLPDPRFVPLPLSTWVLWNTDPGLYTMVWFITFYHCIYSWIMGYFFASFLIIGALLRKLFFFQSMFFLWWWCYLINFQHCCYFDLNSGVKESVDMPHIKRAYFTPRRPLTTIGLQFRF